MERNITCIEDVWKWLDEICDSHEKYSDEELASQFNEVYSFCSGCNPECNLYLISHYRSDQLLKLRAEKYCKENKIKIENYKGPLQYRKYIIDTLPKKLTK